MQGLANWIILSWGWRRYLIAFLAGAASALAQAPVDAAFVLFVTLPVLVWLIDGASPGTAEGLRRLTPAARVGWTFGFGYFLAGISWVGSAFFVEADVFGWMAPFAILGFPAFLALYWALGAALARLLWSNGWPRILALAIGLTIGEWLRGHLFTGFPWNSIAQAVAATDVTAQGLALVGTWGLTFLGIVVFAAPAVFAPAAFGSTRGRSVFAALVALLALGEIAYGVTRLAGADDATVPGVALRIVQPAVNQAEKWDPASARAVLDTLLRLSNANLSPDRPGIVGVTHLIWPETALPFFLTEEPQALVEIGALLPPGTTLVTGAPRFETAPAGRRYFNSVYVIDDGGRILDAYDKVHLVPWGEYVPLGGLLERIGLSSLSRLVGGFSPGLAYRTVPVPHAPAMAPLICYEVIFPDEGVDRDNRPGWIVNVTNDGWFGMTAGPYQHFAQVRMKAIAEGLPVARSANTGISGVVDGYGRVIASLGLGEEGVVDAALPAALPPTFYSRVGDAPAIIVVLAALALILSTRLRALRAAGRHGSRG
jgi:apolipoprotein N-acyltransferase